MRKSNLKPFFEDRIKELGTDEAFADEVGYLENILEICFTKQENPEQEFCMDR